MPKINANVEDFADGEVLSFELINEFEFKNGKYSFEGLKDLYGPKRFAQFLVNYLQEIVKFHLPTYIDKDGVECFKPLKLTNGMLFKIKVDDDGIPIDAIAWYPTKIGR